MCYTLQQQRKWDETVAALAWLSLVFNIKYQKRSTNNW